MHLDERLSDLIDGRLDTEAPQRPGVIWNNVPLAGRNWMPCGPHGLG